MSGGTCLGGKTRGNVRIQVSPSSRSYFWNVRWTKTASVLETSLEIGENSLCPGGYVQGEMSYTVQSVGGFAMEP